MKAFLNAPPWRPRAPLALWLSQGGLVRQSQSKACSGQRANWIKQSHLTFLSCTGTADLAVPGLRSYREQKDEHTGVSLPEQTKFLLLPLQMEQKSWDSNLCCWWGERSQPQNSHRWCSSSLRDSPGFQNSGFSSAVANSNTQLMHGPPPHPATISPSLCAGVPENTL